MKDNEIKVCSNHLDRVTPLIWTFAFPGCEYWCPHCGYRGGMLGAGDNTECTPELEVRAVADKKMARPYIRAISCNSASQIKVGNRWLKPSELSDSHKARNKKIIANWKYGAQAEGGK